MIGEKILGYKVDEKIGSGGFGTVYRVSKTNASGTYVRALKHITIPNQKQYADVLNSMGGDYSKADDYFASVLKEIVNEIQIISTLSEAGTQNIVRYYENDIIETESPKRYNIYILMECLTPFTDYLYTNELRVKDVIKLGKDILTALVSCHAQNVIHRDIKDDNIFVSADGTFKLGDFGVSKMLKDRSRAESMKGTPNFIAPEVYLGKDKYDETVDVYSLGIVLYKLLNKSRNPFLPEFPQVYNSNDEDLAFEKRMKGEVPELPFDAKNELGEVIIKAICKRDYRYNSAKEFLDALVAAEQSLSMDDLDKKINQIIAGSFEETRKKSINPIMEETIGTDMDISITKKVEKNTDRDLFETISDTYNKVPVATEPAIKIHTEPVKETFKPEPEAEPMPNRAESVNLNLYSEQPKVAAVEKSDFRWVAYLLPVVLIAIYVVIYLILLPNVYGEGISVGKWIFNNPEELLTVLQNQDVVFFTIYKIWAFKILMYVLWIGIIASLFNLGRVIQNKKPKYNINAILRDKDAYLKALEINEAIKASKCKGASEAKTAVRNMMECLRNESSFGVGNDAVIACERDIARCLKDIEGNVQALFEEKTAKDAGTVIVANCKTIHTKLRIRTELKKR